ncbi:unnamed protein product [Acanthoscelides obtectus]|uniref:Calponin-homology (CH) domain-containing protein n=1 Tax=Acanthoscelides obtectus TaxID=200917 RepID=A0A9P0LKT0_ACAOB|nr:unnamed protein product [Acanthoscelides obtectus]CAK1686319.1 Leucine-rich repeat and calponin homology domain-containing protein 1 [Acanthoscelides obtectus]
MVCNLQCLNFLDLSRNQLTTLPRELCHLPIQILLVSNNQLTSLPDELCRMQSLAELDASSNRLTHLPPRMGELHRLRALSLRGNLLLAVPVELTQLQLVRLDLRGNRIAQLPLETRRMADHLVELLLDDNPLTSPPPTVCKRGRVHVFKYLEMEASKRGTTPTGTLTNNGVGGTLGRRQRRSNNNGGSGSPLLPSAIPGDRLRKNRQNADSGYSTASDGGWTQEIAQQVKTIDQNSQSTLSTPSTISPAPECTMYDEDTPKTNSNSSFSNDFDKLDGIKNRDLNSVRISPCSDSTLTNSNGIDDKKPLHQIQTYREYKEALKQQRAQDVPSIYRSKDGEQHSYKTEPNTPTHHAVEPRTLATSKSDPTPLNSAFGTPRTIFDDTSVSKKPVQKVIPSRTYSPTPHHPPTHLNGISDPQMPTPPTYVKPRSPNHNSAGAMGHDRIPNGKGVCLQTLTAPTPKGSCLQQTTPKGAGSGKIGVVKTISWDREVAAQGKTAEKMSFTMRREIDKAKEETELINQLRNIIETRLKMVLPEDLAPALTDGVVLCHLANHIRPRSVASIHVPSPAVPKLTMARCRRNVDNFLEACRKIGVDEGSICSAVDITEGLFGGGCGLARLLSTVQHLCKIGQIALKPPPPAPPPRVSSLNGQRQTRIATAQDRTVSFLLLGVFLGTVVLLLWFPPRE